MLCKPYSFKTTVIAHRTPPSVSVLKTHDTSRKLLFFLVSAELRMGEVENVCRPPTQAPGPRRAPSCRASPVEWRRHVQSRELNLQSTDTCPAREGSEMTRHLLSSLSGSLRGSGEYEDSLGLPTILNAGLLATPSIPFPKPWGLSWSPLSSPEGSSQGWATTDTGPSGLSTDSPPLPRLRSRSSFATPSPGPGPAREPPRSPTAPRESPMARAPYRPLRDPMQHRGFSLIESILSLCLVVHWRLTLRSNGL